MSDAKFGSERTVMLGRDVVVLKSVLAVPAWDYVALGHIHRHQELNRGQQPPIVYSRQPGADRFWRREGAQRLCHRRRTRGDMPNGSSTAWRPGAL